MLWMAFLALPILSPYSARGEGDVRTAVEERFNWFGAALLDAKRRAQVPHLTQAVLQIPHRHDKRPSNVAWATQHSVLQHVSVFVMAPFLESANKRLMEHVAFHEVCHVKNGDTLKPYPETWEERKEVEAQAEFCIIRAVGMRRYRAYREEYLTWLPREQKLHWDRMQMLRRLEDVIDYITLHGLPPAR